MPSGAGVQCPECFRHLPPDAECPRCGYAGHLNEDDPAPTPTPKPRPPAPSGPPAPPDGPLQEAVNADTAKEALAAIRAQRDQAPRVVVVAENHTMANRRCIEEGVAVARAIVVTTGQEAHRHLSGGFRWRPQDRLITVGDVPPLVAREAWQLLKVAGYLDPVDAP